jgi:hypothetical protein
VPAFAAQSSSSVLQIFGDVDLVGLAYGAGDKRHETSRVDHRVIVESSHPDGGSPCSILSLRP